MECCYTESRYPIPPIPPKIPPKSPEENYKVSSYEEESDTVATLYVVEQSPRLSVGPFFFVVASSSPVVYRSSSRYKVALYRGACSEPPHRNTI